ncbi:heme lyase CcmF/NrfE family subunit [Pelagibacteraceae bacterium]|jgi:cytochrome c-type biogenesis protein CcmF|nr:heme lyase CcmF/NrfE family subunit [Pelagibacteraceae bacterium]|tara:strand:+ start:702 stop:2582 length:1881 start_codon:yes stop_codon:yes gene_type:complete
MLSNIGNFLIILSIIFSLLIIYYSLLDLKKNNQLINKNIFMLSLYQLTFVIICFATLIAAFIVSDFSLITVFQNSHTSKPLFYKISGTWGNHEGSLLLWINVLVVFSYLFLVLNKKSEKKFRIYTLISQNILILGFLLFLLLSSNPFNLIIPQPNEGLGLNPILQDPALAIHPPLLYIGFVGSSIYFSAAIGSLLSNQNGLAFAKSIKLWVVISWSFQTLGIIVGSIWAYYELGWGGFWFWDPVENASLMPWFVMTALIHSVIVLEKRNVLYPWVIILCLMTFVLSVTGTFLVRSGILNSVHTFANDPSRGLYILIFLSLMIFVSLGIFFNKYKKENYFFSINSKETFILVNNWFMAFYLITVLTGTIYPIFTEVLGGTKISVGPPFYNIIIIPAIIPFLIFMALAPKVSWIKNNFKNLVLLINFGALAIIINFLITYFFRSYSIITNFIIISSLFLILHTSLDFINFFRKKSTFDLSRILSHLGFGLLIFFIGINHNFSTDKDFNLKKGEKKIFENYIVNFKSLEIEERKNYKAIVGMFKITNIKKSLNETLSPEIRIYSNPETLTYEASIVTKLNHDLYLTMSNINRSEFYNIKFQKKPFMIWIWLSAIMISLGGFIRIFKNEN